MLTACRVGVSAILHSRVSKNPVSNPFTDSRGSLDASMDVDGMASNVSGVLTQRSSGVIGDA